MRNRIIALVLAAVFAITGIILVKINHNSADTSMNKASDVKESKISSNSLSDAVAELNIDVLKNSDRSQNLMYSPYGIYTSLMLLANGSQGNTRDMYSSALHFADIEQRNQEIQEYIKKTSSAKDYEMDNVSLMQLSDNLSLSRLYMDQTEHIYRDNYNTDIVTYKNNSSDDIKRASDEINEYVMTKTNGHITDYMSTLSDADGLDIIDIVYFNGTWLYPFDDKNTTDEDFAGINGTRRVKIMNKSLKTKYYEGQFLRAASIPFKGEQMDMIFIMANKDELADQCNPDVYEKIGRTVDEIYTKANTINLMDSIEQADDKTVNVSIPRLDLDMTHNISDTLGAAGIIPDNGDYSGIAENLRLNEITNRSKISIAEEGVEAASVTEIPVVLSSIGGEDEINTIDFVIDEPYIFMLYDHVNDIIIFTGLINDISPEMAH